MGPATAIVVGTAALSSVPLSYLSVLCDVSWGRAAVAVLFGPLAYVVLGLLVVLTGDGPSDMKGGSPLLCHSWATLASLQVARAPRARLSRKRDARRLRGQHPCLIPRPRRNRRPCQVLLGLGRAAWESVSAAATVELYLERGPQARL